MSLAATRNPKYALAGSYSRLIAGLAAVAVEVAVAVAGGLRPPVVVSR